MWLSVVILGHDCSDMLYVLSRLLLTLAVGLHMLQPDVQYLECPL